MPHRYPVRNLQAAARAAAEHLCPGITLGRVILIDAAGETIADLKVPPPEPADPEPVVQPGEETVVDAPGWSFTPTGPAFEGNRVPIRGRQLDVLRCLVDAAEPMTAHDLRRKCWGGYPAEESTVRWTVNELRKSLKAAFQDWPGGDPIVASGDGYWLALR